MRESERERERESVEAKAFATHLSQIGYRNVKAKTVSLETWKKTKKKLKSNVSLKFKSFKKNDES